jgi:hypothetical protein
MTMGEMHPHLLSNPRLASLAARVYPHPPPRPKPVRFDSARHRDVKLLILGCDYRGDPVLECGCTKTRICLAGHGRAIPDSDARDVTDRDCVSCVTGRDFA